MNTRALALALCLGVFAMGCASAHYVFVERPQLVGWKRETVALRGLSFERSFELHWVARDEIPEVVAAIIDEAYVEGHVQAYRDAYAALGVLPPGIDLRATILELQEDQLLGLYDPTTSTMYVVAPAAGVAGEEREIQHATVIHELVHALQHQHFPELFRVQQGLRSNDDVLVGLGAAIEGDASFTMLEPLTWTSRSVKSADLMRDAGLIDLQHPDGLLARIPRWLRDSMFFGYLYGTPIAARYYEVGGNTGLDEFLRDPPLSSLQASRPDLELEVDFIGLPLEALAAAVEPRGCTVAHDNVAGMLTVDVLFRDHEGQAVAAGLEDLLIDWRGDHFVHIDCGNTWELAWFTRWRSPAAAAAFATRYAGIAPALATNAPLSGSPQTSQRGKTVLTFTPGLAGEQELLLDQSEIRSFGHFADWVAADCFPESPCPSAEDPPAASAP